MNNQHRVILIGIVIVYFALGLAFVVRTPAWQAPDEPAHYNYIAQIVNGELPVIEPGDWDRLYLEQLTSANFAPDLLDGLPALRYEDHQPPLYYLLQAPVFALTGGSLIALRIVSLIMGVGVILAAYAIARELYPTKPIIALTAAAFPAFLPQYLVIMSSVSNDAGALLVIAIALLLIVRFIDDLVPAWWLGVIVGIGLLTKVNTLFLVGLVPLAILLKWHYAGRRSTADLIAPLVAFALPVLVIGGVWMIRNVSVYGVPDIFGLGRHDVVVANQTRTVTRIDEIGTSAYLSEAVTTTFNSFIGQPGWMALPLQGWMYTVSLIITISAAVGGLLGAIIGRARLDVEYDHFHPAMWITLTVAALLALAQYLYYNLEFLQLQGRYLFPALIPLALWGALGLDAWRRLLIPQVAIARWLPLIVMATLALLSLYVVWQVIPLLNP